MARHPLFVALALGLAVTPGLALAQACPESQLGCNGARTTTAPLDSTECFSSFLGWYGYARANHVVGAHSAMAWGGFDWSGADATIAAIDVFVLRGPALGPAIEFRAELDVSGSAGGGEGSFGGCHSGSMDFSFGLPGIAPMTMHIEGRCGWNSGSQTFSIPITRLPDEPFTLEILVSSRAGGQSGSSGGSASLRFVGLPPGYSITSCKGFTTSVPVSTRRTTWGKLKKFYR